MAPLPPSFALLALLVFLTTNVAAQPPAPVYACISADPTCTLGASAQCLEYPVDVCTSSGLGTWIFITRNGTYDDPNVPVSSLSYSLTSFVDEGCSLSLGAAFDTGARAGEECFFLGTASTPVGFVSFHEPRSCAGYCGRAPELAYACLFGADAGCGLTDSTTCLPYPLDVCTPSGLGTYIYVTRSGMPYANNTAYELTSFADPACAVTIDPGFDTRERREGECFFLGTAQSPLGFVAFREPSSCRGRCTPPEPTSAFTCLFGADSNCTLSDAAVCLEFPLDTCVLTDFGTYVRVARSGSSLAEDTTYSLESFADANCTTSLGPLYDTGARQRGECFGLGPLGYTAFHEPATCDGRCDSEEDSNACNPTECSTGLQCVDNPGVCGPLNDWSFCGSDGSGVKFTNRLYCPPGWVQCEDNFCAATEDVCLTKGGVKYTTTPCSSQEVIVCDFPLNSGCAFDPSVARCRKVDSTSCNQFYPYFMLLSPSAGNNTFSVQPFSALGCGLDLFNDPSLGVRDLQMGECTSVALPNLAPQQQYDILVMPVEDCPDCPEQFRGAPVVTSFNPTCAAQFSRSECEANGARCTWVGVSWAGCTDPLEAVNVLSAPVSCAVLRLDKEQCESFPGNCVYDDVTGVCEVRGLTEDDRSRLVVSVIWLSFDSEIDVEAPDAPLVPFKDLGDIRYRAVPQRMLGGSRVSGVRGRGLRLHSWEDLEFPDLPTLPLTGWLSNVQLWVLPDPDIRLNVTAGPRADVLGSQNFLYWPSEDAIAALPVGDKFFLLSFGRNGVLVVDWDPAADTITPVASLELDLDVWNAFTIFMVTDNTLLVVHNGQTILETRFPAGTRHLATQRLFYAPSGQGFRGLVDELNTQTVDYAQWAPPNSQLALTSTYHASFSADLLCALRYAENNPNAFTAVALSPYTLGPAAVTSLDLSVSADQPLRFSLDTAVPGLSINASTGIISGIFAEPGLYLLEVAVSGVEDRLCSGFFTTELEVLPPLSIALAEEQPRTLLATAGSFRRFELALNVSGGAAGYTYDARGGPEGLFVQPSDGVLTLASPEAGTFTVRLVVRDALGVMAEPDEDITLVVAPALSLAPVVRTATAGALLVLHPPTVNGGVLSNVSHYSYSLSEVAVNGVVLPTVGGIPGNISLDPITGIIQGVPAQGAEIGLGYEIVDSVQAAFAYRLTITVYPKLTLSLAPTSAVRAPVRREIDNGTSSANATTTTPTTITTTTTTTLTGLAEQIVSALLPISETPAVKIDGGLAPYSFALLGAPAGLVVDGLGRVSGRPADIGSFQVDIRVTDSNGATATLPVLALTVNPRSEASSGGLTRGQSAVTIVLAVLVVFIIAVAAGVYIQRRRRTAYDFSGDIAELIAAGVLGGVHALRKVVSPCELSRDNLRTMEVLGAGEFGEVRRGLLHEKPRPAYTVAVKVCKARDDTDEGRDARHSLLVEALIMQQFDHPNVLRIIGVITRSEPAMVVVPMCDHGSLFNFLKNRTGFNQLVVASRLHIALDVAKGAQYLHEQGFVHRDLAARNVLIAADYTCQISDFGMARGLNSGEYQGRKGKRPIRWLSNEALIEDVYTEYSDVWAFGVLMHEIFTNAERPYNDMTLEEVICMIRDPNPLATLSKPTLCPMDLFEEAMLPCWHKVADKRPRFVILVHVLKQLLAKHNPGAPRDLDDDAGDGAAGSDSTPTEGRGSESYPAASAVSRTAVVLSNRHVPTRGGNAKYRQNDPVSAYEDSSYSAPSSTGGAPACAATNAYEDVERLQDAVRSQAVKSAVDAAISSVRSPKRNTMRSSNYPASTTFSEGPRGDELGFLRYAPSIATTNYPSAQRVRMVEQELNAMGRGEDDETDYQLTREELARVEVRRQALAAGLPDPEDDAALAHNRGPAFLPALPDDEAATEYELSHHDAAIAAASPQAKRSVDFTVPTTFSTCVGNGSDSGAGPDADIDTDADERTEYETPITALWPSQSEAGVASEQTASRHANNRGATDHGDEMDEVEYELPAPLNGGNRVEHQAATACGKGDAFEYDATNAEAVEYEVQPRTYQPELAAHFIDLSGAAPPGDDAQSQLNKPGQERGTSSSGAKRDNESEGKGESGPSKMVRLSTTTTSVV